MKNMAYYGNRPRGRGTFNNTYNPRPNRNFQLQQSRFTYIPRIVTPQISQNMPNQSYVQNNVQQIIDEDPQEFLEKHSINIIGEADIKPLLTLENSILDEDILKTLKSQNITKPTPIQSVCWPLAIKGRDIVGIAQTGSGKTLAFILPALMYIKKQPSPGVGDGPICLVMCPTRELAQQVQQVADTFGKPLNILNTCIYGGAMPKRQTVELKNSPHIVIATPGRLITLLECCETSLNLCSYLILDEADRMLDLGFEKQIQNIAQYLKPDRQTLMFSATWPKEVHALAEEMLRDYVKVVIGDKELTANCNIAQMVEVCQHSEKLNKLYNLLSSLASTTTNYKMIIFVRTKRKCNILNSLLNKRGWPVSCIHGDKQQADREKVLLEFKNGTVPILVATSVASRGLDVEDINYVINFDFPDSMEDYIHRIGRTARSSKTGTAFSYFTERSFHLVEPFIQVLKNAGQFVHPHLYALAKKFSYEPKKAKDMVYGQRSSKGFKANEDSSEDSDAEKGGNLNVSASITQHNSIAPSQTESTTGHPVGYPGGNLPPETADPITKAIGNFIYAQNAATFFPLPPSFTTTTAQSFKSVPTLPPISNYAHTYITNNGASGSGGFSNSDVPISFSSTDQQQDVSITSELARVNRLFEQMQELANNMKNDKTSTASFTLPAQQSDRMMDGDREVALKEQQSTSVVLSDELNRRSGHSRWNAPVTTPLFKNAVLAAPVLQRLEPPRSKLGTANTTTLQSFKADPNVKGGSSFLPKIEPPKLFPTPSQPSLPLHHQTLLPLRLRLRSVAKIPEKGGFVRDNKSRSRSRVGRRGDHRGGRSGSRRRSSRAGSKEGRTRSRYSKDRSDRGKRSSRSRDRRRRTRSPPGRRRRESEERRDVKRGDSRGRRNARQRTSRTRERRSFSGKGDEATNAISRETMNNPVGMQQGGGILPQQQGSMDLMNNFMKVFMGGGGGNNATTPAAPLNIMNNMMTMMMMAMGAAGAAAVQQQQPSPAMLSQLFAGTNSSANNEQATFSNFDVNSNNQQQLVMSGAFKDSPFQLQQQQQQFLAATNMAGQGIGLPPSVVSPFNMAPQHLLSPKEPLKQSQLSQQQHSQIMPARPVPGNFINILPESNDRFANLSYGSNNQGWRDGNDRDSVEDKKGNFNGSQRSKNDPWRPPAKRQFR